MGSVEFVGRRGSANNSANPRFYHALSITSDRGLVGFLSVLRASPAGVLVSTFERSHSVARALLSCCLHGESDSTSSDEAAFRSAMWQSGSKSAALWIKLGNRPGGRANLYGQSPLSLALQARRQLRKVPHLARDRPFHPIYFRQMTVASRVKRGVECRVVTTAGRRWPSGGTAVSSQQS